MKRKSIFTLTQDEKAFITSPKASKAHYNLKSIIKLSTNALKIRRSIMTQPVRQNEDLMGLKTQEIDVIEPIWKPRN